MRRLDYDDQPCPADINFKINIHRPISTLDAPGCVLSCFCDLLERPWPSVKEQAILLAQNPPCRAANRIPKIIRRSLDTNDEKDNQLRHIFSVCRWLTQHHFPSWKIRSRRSQRHIRQSQSQTCQTASIRRRSQMPRRQLSRKAQCGLWGQSI